MTLLFCLFFRHLNKEFAHICGRLVGKKESCMETYLSLPTYLRSYCVEQDYNAYTARDQAAWRYIMRQNRSFFDSHALPIYIKGLAETGISIDRIPRISEMDKALRKFGWGAVSVSGFIPPAAFLEFQARGVLAIACDMRTIENILYTPAPDIVHEAAGHAPIIADPSYANYLKLYAKMAHRAIFSSEDIDVYESIRYLSDIKENPDTTAAQVKKAEERFQEMSRAVTHVSEASEVSRMAWWTVEYGLLGSMEKPLIYGAGLLSSVGESHDYLSDRVKKIPLSVDCVNVSYDITRPQPQLFVAKDMENLTNVLKEYEKTMAFCTGGKEGLEKALRAKSVITIELDSRLQMSGTLDFYEFSDTIDFIKLEGPVQLAAEGRQLLGHGRERHPKGFSSPIGLWENFEGLPREASDEDLWRLGIRHGQEATLVFSSGFTVTGTVGGWYRRQGKLTYITWRNCTVRCGEKVYFEPSWGDFDMAVGCSVVSVFGGPASFEEYGSYNVGSASTTPGRVSAYSEQEVRTFDLYRKIQDFRYNGVSSQELEDFFPSIQKHCNGEWLLILEVMELAFQKAHLDRKDTPWLQSLYAMIMDSKGKGSAQKLFQEGLRLVNVVD